MSNAFDYDLGGSQGRIKPKNASASDGEFVFVLGSDLVPGPSHDLAIGSYAQVKQTIVLDGVVKAVRGSFRVRQPKDLLRRVAIPAPVLVSRTQTTVGAVTRDVTRVIAAADVFNETHVRRLLTIAGAPPPPVVAGTYEVEAVEDARTAILKTAARTTVGAGVDIAPGTAHLVGVRWVYKVIFNGVDIVALAEAPGRDRLHQYTINVSKFVVGAHTLSFRKELIEDSATT